MENLRFKFRVWDKINKEMAYDGVDDKNKLPNYPFNFNIQEILTNCDIYTLMQCVGFTDKNDELIYESDNCNIKDKNGTEFNGVITRNKFNELVFKENEQGVEYHLSDFLKTGYEHTIEITGNIYIINKQ